MLLTRLLPPQFLLPAWTTRQLAQVAQRAHNSDYTRADQGKNVDSPIRQPTKRQLRRLQWSNVRRVNIKTVEGEDGLYASQEELDKPQSHGQRHKSSWSEESQQRRNDKTLKRQDDGSGFTLDTPMKPPVDGKGTVAKGTPRSKKMSEMQFMDPEPQSTPKELSLFEELFPEEALARQRREKKARERLEKLPAFNWAVDTKDLDGQDRKLEQARRNMRENYTSIPEMNTGTRSALSRSSFLAKESSRDRPTRFAAESGKHSRVSILVLKACSRTLEESDFYRVGPKGNHVETWTNGLLKVIPARDNVTLEPLGQYFLLFSSIAAARLYLDKTMRLLELTKSNDFFSKPYGRSRLREGEDLDAILRNFTLVPAGGKLSLRMLHPPYSKGLQWMIEAGGPAPLVARQEKAQNIILFSTDRGHVKSHELENAIVDDGKLRNLHWKLAGAKGEAIVKLETNGQSAGEDVESVEDTSRPRSRYRGPSRYTISFKDSNEARRFVREWHRRPFPTKRSSQPGDDAPPIVNAEILW
ncbi:hypothetical protein BKA64DRAFT_747920 [Cadophora sp. MPI-SDFR-AT-0126]|nr:hypothetical protein BKA64DRAFT_747920 [Leotiomycetes sp. MPI-SDFR-AT-0126]